VVRDLIKREGTELARDTRCWGQAGYAFTTLGLYKEAAAWLADWRERKDAEPWMVFNLAYALRHLGRDEEANEVSRQVLEGCGDHTSGDHRLFLAWDDAIAGRLAEAKASLAQLPEQGGVSFYTVLRGLVAALVAVLSREPAASGPEFASQKILLRQQAWEPHFNNPLLRRYGRSAVARLAAHSGKKPYRLGSFFESSSFRGGGDGRIWGVVVFFLFLLLSQFLRSCQGW
jgi:hypothetical protein